MPPVTLAQVKRAFAPVLSTSPERLEPRYDDVLEGALVKANSAVDGALLGRGYSAAQAQAWDRRAEFVTDLAVFWALATGGLFADLDQAVLDRFDRRKELDLAAVLIGGALQGPQPVTDGGSLGGLGGGRFDTTGYRITMDTVF